MFEELVDVGGVSIKPSEHSFPAAYILLHNKTGMMYIGSTMNLYKRLHLHKSKLRNNKHPNKRLQELCADGSFDFSLMYKSVKDREEGLFYEQKFVDKAKSTKLLLNIGLDVRVPFRGMKLSPEAKNRLRLAANEYFSSQENKDKHAGYARDGWNKPGYRENFMAKLAIRCADKGYVAARTEVFKKMWQDPAMRKRLTNNSIKQWQDPEMRAHLTEKFKERWRDPLERQKHSERQKEWSQDPAHKAKQAAAAKKRMADPELKARMLAPLLKQSKKVKINGVLYSSIKEAAIAFGVPHATMTSRINKGYKDWIIEVIAK